MAVSGRFVLVIEVEGYEDVDEPKAFDVEMKMSSRLKKRIIQWMIDKIKTRVESGRDVNGDPFAPKKDGTPSTLNRTGALLAGIKAAKTSDINAASTKTKALVQLGITDIVHNDPEVRYPWYLHYGVEPERIRAKLIYRLKSKIAYRKSRLERKYKELSSTSIRATATRMKLLDTIDGVKRDIYQLNDQIFAAENREFHTVPARKWWGLTDEERALLDEALSDWVHLMMEGTVGAACNPEKEPPDQVSKRVETEIMKRFT